MKLTFSFGHLASVRSSKDLLCLICSVWSLQAIDSSRHLASSVETSAASCINAGYLSPIVVVAILEHTVNYIPRFHIYTMEPVGGGIRNTLFEPIDVSSLMGCQRVIIYQDRCGWNKLLDRFNYSFSLCCLILMDFVDRPLVF